MQQAPRGIRRRVVFVLPHFDAGGVERIVLNLLIHLDRARFAPGLVLFNRRGALLPQLPQDVDLRDLGGRSARQIVPRLARLLDEMGAEAVYGGTNAANLVCLAAGLLRRSGPPVIVSEHTPLGPYLADAKLPGLRRALMRLLYPRAAVLAVPVREVGEDVRRQLGLPDLSVVSLPNPLVTVQAAPPRRLGMLPPVFLSAGRLVPEKGFDILIQAFARLSMDCPQARLTIFGEGPERANLEALCRRLELSQQVSLPGFVPDPVGNFSGPGIFVLASRREGFGNVLIEALAAGLPVIAADCPVGPRLILEDGRYGLLAPPNDPEALAGAMARLLADPAMAESFIRRGAERAAAFDIATAVEGFSHLFERVTVRRAAPILQPAETA